MDIPHYRVITPRIAISGQLSRGDFEQLADNGISSIIDLAKDTNGFDELSWVTQLGMSYQAIPIDFKHPSNNNFLRFLNVMNLQQEKQICIHDRDSRIASVFVSLYLVMSGEIEQSDGMNLIRDIWLPEPHWEGFYYEVLNQFYEVKQEIEAI